MNDWQGLQEEIIKLLNKQDSKQIKSLPIAYDFARNIFQIWAEEMMSLSSELNDSKLNLCDLINSLVGISESDAREVQRLIKDMVSIDLSDVVENTLNNSTVLELSDEGLQESE
jgi:hypothetical protein